MYSLCAAISFVVPDSLSERICSRFLSDCSEKSFFASAKICTASCEVTRRHSAISASCALVRLLNLSKSHCDPIKTGEDAAVLPALFYIAPCVTPLL